MKQLINKNNKTDYTNIYQNALMIIKKKTTIYDRTIHTVIINNYFKHILLFKKTKG